MYGCGVLLGILVALGPLIGHGVAGAGLLPFLTQIIPALISDNKCNARIDTILDSIVAKESPQQCTKCDVMANLTRDITDLLSHTARQAPKNLIKLHCVKAGSNKIFPLNLHNLQRNPTKQFNNNFPYGFLMHGFTDFYPGQWPIQGEGWMRHTILEWAKYGTNVCAVDWGKLSMETLNYFVVSQINTVRVANYLLEILLRFERYGLDLMSTTLAGHSLGAQISGKVGAALKTMNKTLGRIYGIDPAGPCYTHPCTVSEKERLDANDADYVQCIHSNIGLWGTIPRCGCEDFYLNAAVFQPGAIDPISAHYFSVNIFDWTLNPKHRCFSTAGRQLIGINSRRVCGIYKVKTFAKQPYC